MILVRQGEYDLQRAAICFIAPKISCTPETLRVWGRQHERATGSGNDGLTATERQQSEGHKLEVHDIPQWLP
ncbi:putative transposase family protein [Escherichia coli]|jgi:transposase|uniref:Transposase family protein n=2 Tax=Escherichia coli TaxID=562 RepID=A0AB38F2E0_ECOLX|nr:hypothetical protein [Escherichia coli O55:H7]KYR87371.1 transposase [Escherichia coli]GEI29889.1 IS629 transposase OrfA [Escherichia coli O145:H25]KYS16487.1 transposase [Escherichia coli]KYS66870.1 transposase [Escherichia coli]